jgi:tetratricopeptide (TPR) repeat protein
VTLSPKVLGGSVATRVRWYRLRAHRLAGRVQATRLYHWAPFLGWLALTAAVLTGAQLLVNDVLAGLPIWGWLEIGEPHVNALSLEGVLLAYACVMGLRWLTRARERVVVDDFVDFTTHDAKAVSGMATLLATELTGLRSLYSSINDTLAVPVAVGVHSHSSGGRDAEPGAFLSVRADDLSDMLKGAVASEAKISVGPLLLPIGSIAALFGRLVRGPRVLGSVHRTESGGGPTLTAQILGARQKRTWRVDRSQYTALTSAEDKAFLDEMVRELAVQMFTDLSMRGSVRWSAIRTFTEYLRNYRDSMRTPKSRGRFLKDAEERLLEAIAEDELFDFAYYNLGVIYSQLAAAELSAARRWDIRPRDKVDPDKVHESRMHAATVAFTRAIERNRNRWEAHYALAVHHMARMNRLREEAGAKQLGAADVDTLREVMRLCDRVIKMQPRNAEAYDLRGMAIQRLIVGGQDEGIDIAISCHRRAVRLAWRNLCREERRAKAEPPTTETALIKRQENAAAALHNLALAYALKAKSPVDTGHVRNFRRADLVFAQAIKLAPVGSAASSHFERARTLRRRGGPETPLPFGHWWSPLPARERWKRREALRQALEAYEEAATREPENPLYLAQLARARAEAATDPQQAEVCVERTCRAALESLAPVWRRSLSSTPAKADKRMTRRTFKALAEAYEALARISGSERAQAMRARSERVRELHGLCDTLTGLGTAGKRAVVRELFEKAIAAPAAAGEPLGEVGRRIWEVEQLGVSLARAYVAAADEPAGAGREADPGKEALEVLDSLIAFADAERPRAIGAHELEVRKANVLRREDRAEEALEWVSRGLMRDPLSDRAHSELAEIHMWLWQYDEALAAWEHTLWLKPNDPYVHFKLGLCHWWRAEGGRDRSERMRSLERARELIAQAHTLFSREDVVGRSWLRLWRGRIALDRGLHDEAIMHLRAAKSFSPCCPPARALLGEAYLSSDELTLAEQEFDAALEAVAGADACAWLDAGWGDSLTVAQLRARCRRGIASVLVQSGNPKDARERIATALGDAEKIALPDEQAHAKALCYDTDAVAIMAQNGTAGPNSLKEAEAQLAKAIALHPFAAAYLHRVQVHEREWELQPDPVKRRRLLDEVLAFKREIDRLDRDGSMASEAAAIASRLDDAYYSGPATDGVLLAR